MYPAKVPGPDSLSGNRFDPVRLASAVEPEWSGGFQSFPGWASAELSTRLRKSFAGGSEGLIDEVTNDQCLGFLTRGFHNLVYRQKLIHPGVKTEDFAGYERSFLGLMVSFCRLQILKIACS